MSTKFRAYLRSFYDLRESWAHLLAGLLLAGAAGLVLWAAPELWGLSISLIAMVDVYLLLLLWSTASRASSRDDLFPTLPNKKAACLLLPSLLATLVFAFGAIYVGKAAVDGQVIQDPSLAAFHSFRGSTTFSYDVKFRSAGQLIVFAQVMSSILLMICAVPLLIARLSIFGGGGVRSIEYHGCRILLPDNDAAKVSIDSTGQFVWASPDGKRTVLASSTAAGVKVTSLKVWPVASLVMISPNGDCACDP